MSNLFRACRLLLLLACLAGGAAGGTGARRAVPVHRVRAGSLYDAGRQIGRLARDQILRWTRMDEFGRTAKWCAGDGRAAFERLKADNARAFPEYVDEMRGLADGSGATLDEIWIANLTPELEPLLPPAHATARVDHCTDIFGHNTTGSGPRTVVQGHNEDWSTEIKQLWYFTVVEPLEGANFSACAGMSYPGTLLGYAPTWSPHGIYSTQNTLFPKTTRAHGLACTFVQRRATCGRGVTTLDAFAARLHTRGWAAGASLNVVDLDLARGGAHQTMANIEVYEDQFSRLDVDTNYSHENMFKHLGVPDAGDNSTEHRQSRIDRLPAPHSVADVANILGDTADAAYPLYRTITLASLILDGATGVLSVWVDSNPAETRPVFAFPLASFFSPSPALEGDGTVLLSRDSEVDGGVSHPYV